jgi:hypothetical protein
MAVAELAKAGEIFALELLDPFRRPPGAQKIDI